MAEIAESTNSLDNEHIPANTKAGLMAMNAMKPLANLPDPSIVIDRLLSGESVKSVADSFNISDTAVYTWLVRNYPNDLQEIRAGNSLAKLDQCESMLDEPISEETFRVDGVKTNRASAKIRAHQWNLERANRKLFGESKDRIDLNINEIRNITVVLPGNSALSQALAQAGTGQVIEGEQVKD